MGQPQTRKPCCMLYHNGRVPYLLQCLLWNWISAKKCVICEDSHHFLNTCQGETQRHLHHPGGAIVDVPKRAQTGAANLDAHCPGSANWRLVPTYSRFNEHVHLQNVYPINICTSTRSCNRAWVYTCTPMHTSFYSWTSIHRSPGNSHGSSGRSPASKPALGCSWCRLAMKPGKWQVGRRWYPPSQVRL